MLQKIKDMSMGKRLKILRLINSLSQKQLADNLNVSEKIISAWENEETEINLKNATIIAEFFRVPNSFFVFGDNIGEIPKSQFEKFIDQLYRCDLIEKADQLTGACKLKLEHDGIALKEEYIPVFDSNLLEFTSTGIFEKSIFEITSEGTDYDHILNPNTYGVDFHYPNYHKEFSTNTDVANVDSIPYEITELFKYGLYDLIDTSSLNDIELKSLVNCNNLDVIQKALEIAGTKKFPVDDYFGRQSRSTTEGYVSSQLNSLLENLNPTLPNFWYIIVFLIDSGAFYEKRIATGSSDAVSFKTEKDVSKTNLVYRLATEMKYLR